MRVEQGVAWVDLEDGTFRTATPGECAARIAELEAALRELLDTFNPGPRMDNIGLIWGRAAKALKGNA